MGATEADARLMAFLGVVDESTPAYEADAVVYAVALALFDDRNSDLIRQDLRATLNRKRPFHWESEGPVVKAAVVDRLCRIPIEAHVSARIAARSEQQAARDEILTHDLLPYAIGRSIGGFRNAKRSKREDHLGSTNMASQKLRRPHSVS